MICLLVLTDGRDDLLEHTITSAKRNLDGSITRGVIHTDAGEAHRAELALAYPRYEVIGGRRLGFGGAIDRAWRFVGQLPERFIFHLEDDFTFNRRVDLDAMSAVLDTHPHVMQMALRRQPWNDPERQAGGIVEQWPQEYSDCAWDGHQWLEHRLFLTTNPALWRASDCANGWPVVDRSERAYSDQRFADPTACAGFWGARDSGEAVHHIGAVRVGHSY